MGKSALTPQQVVNNNLTFAIPIYQRLFAWSEDQILPLLLDLLYSCVKTRESHYYIGLLTTKNQDLVDGQQRFTVMTLIALVLREKMSTRDSWNRFLLEGNSLRLTFKARKNDEEFLRRLVDMDNCVAYLNRLFHSEGTAIEDYYNDMMAKGILTIAHFFDNLQTHVEEMLGLKPDKSPSIDDFGNYVYEHLAFFTQEIPEGYSPRMMNKYFESMNSTGRNLENHEILKVDLLKAAFPGVSNGEEYNKYVYMWNKASQMDRTIFGSAEENSNKYISFIKGDNDPELHPVEDKSMTIEDAISGKISKSEISSSNQKETRLHSFLNFTDFLLQVLWLELQGKTLNEDHKIIANRFFKREELGKTFKTYLEYIDPKDFILKVYKYRIILDWAIIRIDGEGDYELLAESSSEYSKLEQYEAMLFASSSQYTYYHWLPLILKEVLEHGYNKDELLVQLKKIDNKIHPKPEQVLDYRYRIDTYYFRRLDYYIWEKVVFHREATEEQKNILLSDDEYFLPGVIESIKSYKFHQYNSIEHLYPQNEQQQLELNKWSQNDSDLDHLKILNEFGNLALISGVYNSTQNNQSLNHKFVNVAEHVIKKKIESIKLAIMYCCANGDLKNWTKPKAVKHQEKMMKILEDSYNGEV